MHFFYVVDEDIKFENKESSILYGRNLKYMIFYIRSYSLL